MTLPFVHVAQKCSGHKCSVTLFHRRTILAKKILRQIAFLYELNCDYLSVLQCRKVAFGLLKEKNIQKKAKKCTFFRNFLVFFYKK